MRLSDFKADKNLTNRHAHLFDDRFLADCLDCALQELVWRSRDAKGAEVTAAAYKAQGAMEFLEIFRGMSTVPDKQGSLYDMRGLHNPDAIVKLKAPKTKTIDAKE